MTQFLDGMSYFFAGFGLITKPGLRRFVILPLLINVLFFILLYFMLRHYVVELNEWSASLLPDWMRWMGAVIWLLFFISFFLVFMYAFVAIGTVIAAPFNGLLSQKVEVYLTGASVPQTGILDNIKDVPRVMARQISIIGFYMPRAIVLLILMLIPVLHSIAVLLWFVLSAWYLTLQYLDFPTDNHKVPIAEVRQWMRQHRWEVWGFALALMMVMSIPLINFFAIPAAAAGATQFWLERR